MKIENFRDGFGLIEIVVVTAIVSVALFAFSQAGILAVRTLRLEKESLEATLLAEETMEAVRSLRDESWTSEVAPLANDASYYPTIISGKWSLSSSAPELINGKYNRFVIFEEVFRDGLDRIASSGTSDPNTRKMRARVEWISQVGSATTSREIELVTYITNFLEEVTSPSEILSISFEGGTTDADLANFPDPADAGNGDPAQSFTVGGTAIQATKVELYLRPATTSPSDLYAEIRASPVGGVLGRSNIIDASTISTSTLNWVEFRFPDPIQLVASTEYFIRLRSVPDSTVIGSGTVGPVHWGYLQTASSPYAGGVARRHIGRQGNPADEGQLLDQYDFSFKVYALQ